MKIRILLTALVITLLLSAIIYQAPLSQASHLDPREKPSLPLQDWLRARIKAQQAGSEAAQELRSSSSQTARLLNQEKLLNQLANPVHNFFEESNKIDKTDANDLLFSTQFPFNQEAASISNIRINDPSQESGERVQNSTASAASGQNIVVAYNNIGTNAAGISYSNDGGLNWRSTLIPQLSGQRNLGSGIVAARGETFYYAGVAVTEALSTVIISSRSLDAGRNWSMPIVVQQLSSSVTQDKPWIVVDNSNGPTAGNVYISWTEFRTFFGSRIICATSTNAGQSFPTVVALSTIDNTFSVQGSTIGIGPSGEVYIAWGDLRSKGIVFARSTNAGENFSRPITAVSLRTYELIGPLLNSHFGANGLPSIAVDAGTGTNRGNIYIVFSAPSPERPMDKANVFLVRSTDRGMSWSQPQIINDDGGVTDQFMPSAAVAADGTVALMWYDRRNDPIHNALLDVFATISTDGGLQFSPNRRITSSNWVLLTTPITVRNNYHGDYNQMSVINGVSGTEFFFNWGDDRSGLDADVYGARVSAQNLATPLPSITLLPTTLAQTVVAGQGTLFRLRINKTGDLSAPLNFAASSDTNAINFQFDNRNTVNADEVLLQVRTNPTVSVGTHPIVINITANGIISSTTLRLNVLAAGPLARLPQAVSSSPGRSIQPHVAIDTGGVINTVWIDDAGGNFRVLFSRS
ncbi:MAG: sialidase family protein, partial [Acidobacteriota bacterium]